jgi:hypothetical protein
MSNYLAYWKRGWWALGLIISINIILGVVYASLAFLLQPLLANPFPVAVAIAWLGVGAPIAGHSGGVGLKKKEKILFLTVIHRISFATAVCLVAGYAATARAETSPTVQYLMREPATLWDLGIARMQIDLGFKSRDFVIAGKHASTLQVAYRSDANRLQITAVFQQPEFSELGPAKQACTQVIGDLRAFFLVDPSSGRPFAAQLDSNSGSSAATYFTHAYFDTGRETANFEKNIDALIAFQVVVMSRSGRALTCSAPLIGRTVTYDR